MLNSETLEYQPHAFLAFPLLLSEHRGSNNN